jgi:hypothetical protein
MSMTIRLTLIFSFALLLASGLLPTVGLAARPNAYLCVTELATGFTFDKQAKRWSIATSPIGKYVVSRRQPDEHRWDGALPYEWKVIPVGSKSPEAFCNEDIANEDALVCRGDSEFRLNKKALRFERALLGGYWAQGFAYPGGQEGDFASTLSMGKCNPM